MKISLSLKSFYFLVFFFSLEKTIFCQNGYCEEQSKEKELLSFFKIENIDFEKFEKFLDDNSELNSKELGLDLDSGIQMGGNRPLNEYLFERSNWRFFTCAVAAEILAKKKNVPKKTQKKLWEIFKFRKCSKEALLSFFYSLICIFENFDPNQIDHLSSYCFSKNNIERQYLAAALGKVNFQNKIVERLTFFLFYDPCALVKVEVINSIAKWKNLNQNWLNVFLEAMKDPCLNVRQKAFEKIMENKKSNHPILKNINFVEFANTDELIRKNFLFIFSSKKEIVKHFGNFLNDSREEVIRDSLGVLLDFCSTEDFQISPLKLIELSERKDVVISQCARKLLEKLNGGF